MRNCFRGGPNIPEQFALILGVWLVVKMTVPKPPPEQFTFKPTSKKEDQKHNQ